MKLSQKIYINGVISTVAAVFPLFALAATQLNDIPVNLIITSRYIIQVLFVLATIIFLWGVISFISNSQDETKRNKSKAIMTYGIIGLAVMVAAWGVAFLLAGYFLQGGEGQGIPPGVGNKLN